MLLRTVRDSFAIASLAFAVAMAPAPVFAAQRGASAVRAASLGVSFGHGIARQNAPLKPLLLTPSRDTLHDRDVPRVLESSPLPKPSASAFPNFANPLRRHRMADGGPFVPIEGAFSF